MSTNTQNNQTSPIILGWNPLWGNNIYGFRSFISSLVIWNAHELIQLKYIQTKDFSVNQNNQRGCKRKWQVGECTKEYLKSNIKIFYKTLNHLRCYVCECQTKPIKKDNEIHTSSLNKPTSSNFSLPKYKCQNWLPNIQRVANQYQIVNNFNLSSKINRTIKTYLNWKSKQRVIEATNSEKSKQSKYKFKKSSI